MQENIERVYQKEEFCYQLMTTLVCIHQELVELMIQTIFKE